MVNIFFDYLPVIVTFFAAIVLFIGDKFSWVRKSYIIGVIALLFVGAVANGFNIWRNDSKQAKLLSLIKKSELSIGTLLQQVAAGNVDNKIILEKLESIHKDLILALTQKLIHIFRWTNGVVPFWPLGVTL